MLHLSPPSRAIAPALYALLRVSCSNAKRFTLSRLGMYG